MKIKLQTIGNAEIEFETSSDKAAIENIAFWQSLPYQCGICSAPVVFSFRSPQNYKYYGLVCTGATKHESNFGQHQTGDSLYYKNDWHEVQYSVQSERDAEIAKYDNAPNDADGERAALITAIKKGMAAVKNLGGKVDAPNFQNMSIEELQQDLTAVREQYDRLKRNGK